MSNKCTNFQVTYWDVEYIVLRRRLELLELTEEKITKETATKKLDEQIQLVLQNVKSKDRFQVLLLLCV